MVHHFPISCDAFWTMIQPSVNQTNSIATRPVPNTSLLVRFRASKNMCSTAECSHWRIYIYICIYIYIGICTEYVNVCAILMPSLGGNRSESMPLFLSLTKQPVPFSDLQLLPAWNISNLIPKWQRLDLRELSAINRDSWLCKSIDVIQLSSASSIEFAQFDGLMDLQCRCTLLLGLASKKSN